MAQTETKPRNKTNIAVRPPSLFRVIYINDNQTTVEFVMDSLVEYFGYSPESAEQITIDIHEAGSAVVAVLPFEIAEQKGIEVTMEARSQSYPLQIKLEPEEVH